MAAASCEAIVELQSHLEFHEWELLETELIRFGSTPGRALEFPARHLITIPAFANFVN